MFLRCGTIVWAIVADPTGRNHKRRPAVIVTPTAEILPGQALDAVAVTSHIPPSLPETSVELPWQIHGHPRTGLFKRCVARCDWLLTLAESDVLKVGGTVPDSELRQILAKLRVVQSHPQTTLPSHHAGSES
ncbi:MAG: type II toxin-antitoxin system PemK/MazF family toxin [Planctomycetaceae bacterium]